MHLVYPRSLNREILEQSEFRIRSNQLRLKQLQLQLEQKYFKRQNLNAIIHEQRMYQKVLEQQDLLIFHLKQQILKLSQLSADCQQIQTFLRSLQLKFIKLEEQKRYAIQKNLMQLNQHKLVYSSLQVQLKQLTLQSGRLYNKKVKLQESYSIVRELLQQKIKQKVSENQNFTKQKNLNTERKHQNQIQTQQNNILSSKRTQLQKQNQKQKINYETNLEKLARLEIQVKNKQIQNEKLKNIQKTAQKDSFALKQCLKNNTQKMKITQENLSKLNIQKQNLQKQKQSAIQNLTATTKLKEQEKNSLDVHISEGKHLQQKLQKIIEQKLIAQQQIAGINYVISKEKQRKIVNLDLCRQTQDQLEKSFYYIDQYVILNYQLVRQIEILVSQDVQKNAYQIGSIRDFQSRNISMLQIREFLKRANQQIWNVQKHLSDIKNSLNIYKICNC